MTSLNISNDKMVTRFKSAQQRRLRPIDRSMTSLTKLLKSPERSKRRDNLKKSPKTNRLKQFTSNSTIKNDSANSKSDKVGSIEEYYPNKLKRHAFSKKIVLKPKYNMKIVAKTSKRKFSTPNKGFRSPVPSPKTSGVSSPEPSIVDVIRVFEETQELDDEDLMEILTCPSPVWWEDPPDHTFIEDPICRRTQLDIEAEHKENQPETKTKEEETNIEINLLNKDTNFKRKRSKLECLLMNLKGKVCNGEISSDNNHLNRSNKETTKQDNDSTKPSMVDAKENKTVLNRKKTDGKCNVKQNRRRKMTVVKKNTKVKEKSKKVDKSIFTGNIKIKNCEQINREALERLSTENGDTNTEIDLKVKDSKEDIKDLEQIDQIKNDLKNSDDTKDVEDSVLSDNTNLSEISISEDLIADLENMNIPIRDNTIEDPFLELNPNDTVNNECLANVKEEPSKFITNENSDEVLNKLSSENALESTDDKDTEIATTSAAANEMENKKIYSETELESLDCYDFDLEFENAILGLENTVLQSKRAKKRIPKPKLNNKPCLDKDLRTKDKKIEDETGSIKIGIAPKLFVGSKRKQSKNENISQRGRIRRKKAPFGFDKNNTEVTDIDGEIPDDYSEEPFVITNAQNTEKTQSATKRKNLPIIEVYEDEPIITKNEITEEVYDAQESNTDNVGNISKRGRIRRKKLPFTIGKTYSKPNKHDNIEKTKEKTDKIIFPKKKFLPKSKLKGDSTLNNKSEDLDIVDMILDDLETKFLNKDSKSDIGMNIPKTGLKQYVNNKNKPKDIDTTPDINTVTENKETMETITVIEVEDTEKVPKDKQLVDGKETFLSVFKKYGELHHPPGIPLDMPKMPKLKRRSIDIESISDSDVTFIDESSDTKRHKTRNKLKKTNNESKTDINTDLEVNLPQNDADLNVHNLGPNYKNVSPQKDMELEKQNEQIVLNTDSKKIVTVQSDKEVFDTSDDIETITVFKIIPKDMQ